MPRVEQCDHRIGRHILENLLVSQIDQSRQSPVLHDIFSHVRRSHARQPGTRRDVTEFTRTVDHAQSQFVEREIEIRHTALGESERFHFIVTLFQIMNPDIGRVPDDKIHLPVIPGYRECIGV